MGHRFRVRLSERTLDIIDWVDIRPDPHWTSYALVPLVLGISLLKVPEGFLPLFLVLCAMAAVVSVFLAVIGIAGIVLWRAMSDVILVQLANCRDELRETVVVAKHAGRNTI